MLQNMLPSNVRVCEVFRVLVNKLTAKSRTLCLDGTSATKKSTILYLTDLSIIKVQRCVPSREVNTYAPSMIGYILSGIKLLNCSQKPQLMDRSPLNPMEWAELWLIFELFLKRFGNVTVQPKGEHHEFVKQMIERLKTFSRLPHYRHLRERINTIVVIDTNIDRCDTARKARNFGSDDERSNWKFYTYFQNLMYQILYPETYIDLNWFNVESEDEVIEQLAMCLRATAIDLSEKYPCNTDTPMYPIPLYKENLTLRNAEACVWRATSKIVVAQTVNEENDEPINEDCLDIVKSIENLVPKFVQINGIEDLYGNKINITNMDPIHLFDKPVKLPPINEDDNENNNNNCNYKLQDVLCNELVIDSDDETLLFDEQ